jgi:hypothetical protein
MKNKILAVLVTALLGLMFLSGCSSDSEIASDNVSKDADNFKVLRKITFINTESDAVLFTVEGNMSITADKDDNQLEIIAKTGRDKFQKHILGLSPKTVYIVQQLEWHKASQYQFKIIFKPSTLVPDVEVR